MTDDLVKRLRDNELSFRISDTVERWDKQRNEAADRIEQLDASSEGWKEIADEYFDAIGERNTRIEKLEEQIHYANGVADLAMKHRDYAEQRVEKLEAALRDVLLWTDDCNACDYDDDWSDIEVRARKALEGKE